MNMLANPAIWTLLLLALGTVLVLLFGHGTPLRLGRAAAIANITLLLVLGTWWVHAQDGHGTGFDGMFVLDRLGVLAAAGSALAGFITSVMLTGWLRRQGRVSAEVHALLLLAVAGMQVMVQTRHLAVMFLGLETMSVALYALCAALRERRTAVESGFKYFLTGAFASAVLLFAIALWFGLTGSFQVDGAANLLARSGDVGVVILVLFVAAFGFKLSVVPFHQWAPDVYEGAPTPVTGFMATAVKLVGFLTLFRLLPALAALSEHTVLILSVLAIATMAVGNLGALLQVRVKRMLAFSSVAHAGYLLAGAVVFAAAPAGSSAATGAFVALGFYLIVYVLMNLLAFGVLSLNERAGDEPLLLDDLAGLRQRRPWMAAAMLVAMLSLAGVPLTGGFLAKWRIFSALLGECSGVHSTLMIVLASAVAVCSVVGLAYYLRVAMTMYVERSAEAKPLPVVPLLPLCVVMLLAGLVLWLGIAPASWAWNSDAFADWLRLALTH
jgi:NADH-quinone oxidoreductase subunit N